MDVPEYVIDIPAEFKPGQRELNLANVYVSSFEEITDWRLIIGVGYLYEGDCIHCIGLRERLCSYITLLREDKLVFSPIGEYKLPPYFTNSVWPLSYWEHTSIQYFHVDFAGSIIEEYNPTFKMFRIVLRTGEEITLSHSCGPLPRHFLQALTADHAEPFLTHITNNEGQLLGSLHQFPSTAWGSAMKALMYADLNMKREGELALDILPYSMLATMGPPIFPNPNTNQLITNATQQMAAIKEELTPWIHRGPGSIVGQYL